MTHEQNVQVGARQGGIDAEVLDPEQVRRQARDMRLHGEDRAGVAAPERAHDLERRALAQVVDVGLEGEAQAGDA